MSKEIKPLYAVVVAVAVGLVAFFGLAMLPTWLAPYAAEAAQLNITLTSVLLILLFSIVMAVAWPRLKGAYQVLLVLVLLVAGIGLAVPVFIAIGVVGIVLSLCVMGHLIGRRGAL